MYLVALILPRVETQWDSSSEFCIHSLDVGLAIFVCRIVSSDMSDCYYISIWTRKEAALCVC